MIKQDDLDLLSDIAKLWKKYGPEAFERLRYLMNSGMVPSEIEQTLSAVARSVKTRLTPFETPINPDMSHRLLGLRDLHPAKYAVLKRFCDDLATKKILPTNKDLASFGAHVGLVIPKKASRYTIVSRILDHLANRSLDQIETWIRDARRIRKNGQTLSEWADIIMKPKEGEP